MKKRTNNKGLIAGLVICLLLVGFSVGASSFDYIINNVENLYVGSQQLEGMLGGDTNFDSIDVTDGYKVDGTTVIDGDGNWDGAVTGSSATLSSTLGVTGATTLSSTLSVTGVTTLTGKVTMKEATTAITAITSTTTVAQSGTTFYIELASTTAGATINLPALTDGVNYRYVMATSSATTTNIVIGSLEGDNIYGSLIVDGTAVPCDAEDQINIVVTSEIIGDFVELRSDGSRWYVYGVGEASGAITCTDPS